MTQEHNTLILRARDFWASWVLLIVAVFFLWKTTEIPLWGDNRSGVSGTDWYTSAALAPLGIFTGLVLLSLGLMVQAIRSGGARQALRAAGIGWNPVEVSRFLSLSITLAAYIIALVPRVDFIVSSGLLITALIYGYYGGHARRAWGATACMVCPAAVALVWFYPQSAWGQPADDWFALAVWIGFSVYTQRAAKGDRVMRVIPVIAVLAPTVLVCAMAFGFRQNVPARSGVLFKPIEYHYYVTLRPLWRP